MDIICIIVLGELIIEEKIDYILVLKGYIVLVMVVFFLGIRGVQLDVFVCMLLWSYKMNFLYGIGYGVGYFLSVYEGL